MPVADAPKRSARPSARTSRSAVTNGSATFLGGVVDGRTAQARRFRDLVAAITRDLGGPDGLSEAQRQLVRRAASLSVMCELLEARLARAEDVDPEAFGKLCDRLNRTLRTLGIERIARDRTPSLDTYNPGEMR